MASESSKKPLDCHAYIKALYNTIFGRNPETKEVDSWLNVLNNGYTYKKLLSGFVNSDEFKNLCNGLGIEPGTYYSDEIADQGNKYSDLASRMYRYYKGKVFNR